MAGLIDLISKNHFGKNETIVFLHTGGSAGLFAYRSAFDLAEDADKQDSALMDLPSGRDGSALDRRVAGDRS
jgi:hypothetical protein